MLQQKATAIINCFLDSPIPPSIQVTVEPEIAQIVLERRSELPPNMFREAQVRELYTAFFVYETTNVYTRE
jgi:hypothetical protein